MSAQTVKSIPSGEDVVLLTAPFFVASLLNCLFLGTLIVQVYIYSISYPLDIVGLKVIVYGLFVLDILQTIFGTHATWYYLISKWGNPTDLFKFPWSFTGVLITNSITSAAVQNYFSARIWKLKRTWLARSIAVLIMLVALMQSISNITAAAELALVDNNDPNLTTSVKISFLIATSGSFVADTLIAGCQIAILWEAHSKSSFKHTETIISKLVFRTVETAAVTAIVSLVWLILYITKPNTFLAVPSVFMIGKLYSNVLLANLNARSRSPSSASMDSGTYPLNLIDVVHITTEVTTDQLESPNDWKKSVRINEASVFP